MIRFFTGANELCHVIFHYKYNILFLEKDIFLSINKYGIEADTFVAELLIDDSVLDEYERSPLYVIADCDGVNYKYFRFEFDLI